MLIFWAVVVYVGVTVCMFLKYSIDYAWEKEYKQSNYHYRGSPDVRGAARKVLRSPLWPVDAVRALKGLRDDAT